MTILWANLVFIANIICCVSVLKRLRMVFDASISHTLLKPRYILFKREPGNILLQKQYDTIKMFDVNRRYAQVVKDNLKNKIIPTGEIISTYCKKYSKLIIITPGGINGFYMMGIIKYITERICLDDYIFSGASAGAWCCLFLCLKTPVKFITLLPKILADLQDILYTSNSLYHILYSLKSMILEVTTTSDYDFERLFIGVLRYEAYSLTTNIYSNFTSLEDAIDCCISSSHIPFITGEFSYMYQGRCVFDGAFSKYPFLNAYTPTIVIDPNIWKPMSYGIFLQAMSVSTKNVNISEMFWDGYRDTVINGEMLMEMLDSPSV